MKDNSANLRALLESTVDMFWSVDTSYRLINANFVFIKSVIPVYGKEIEQGCLLVDKSILSAEMYKEWKSLYDRCLSGERFKIEVPAVLSDTAEYLEVSYNPIYDDNKKITGVSAIAVNVTKHKQAQEQLLKYKHVVSSSTDMMALLDKQYKYIVANNVYMEAFKLESEQIIGKTVGQVFGEEFFKTVIKPNADKCMKGKNVNFQDWFDFPAYGKCYMDINYFPYYDTDKKVVGFVVNGRNITQYKQADDNLQKSKETTDRYLNIAAEIIISLDSDGNITLLNDSGYKLLGYKPGSLIGKNWFDTCLQEEIKEEVSIVFESLMNKDIENIVNYENTVITKNAKEKIISWHNSLLMDDEDNIIGLLSSGEDITKRKQAERLQSVVYEISKAAQSVKNLDELYKTIHASLKQVLDVTNFYIAYYDEKEQMLDFPFYKDIMDNYTAGYYPFGSGITEYIIKKGKSLILKKKDILEYNRKGIFNAKGFLAEQWMGSPLKIGNKVIGVIACNSYHDPNLYDDSDLKILTFVSEQIARAVEHVSTIIQREKEKELQNVVYQISNATHSVKNLDELYKTIHNTLARVFDVKNFYIAIYDDKEHSLSFPFFKDAKEVSPESAQPFGSGLTEYVIKTGKPLLLNKKDKDEYTRKGLFKSIGVASELWMGAPLSTEKRIIGVIALNSYDDPNLYDDSDLKILTFVSEQIALAIEYNQSTEDLHKSEERYRTLSEELTDSNSMKGLLLDVIAHDLKNPAGAIKGFAEFGLENDPNNEILDEINQSTDSLLNVINGATTLSKLTLGDAINKEELNLVNIINRIIRENKAQLQIEEMTLNMKLKGELLVNANPIICEVFRNYISNAIKYAMKGKIIIIDATEEDGYVTINVKDFGKTINKKDRENIFTRNVQLGKTDGRGLGLAIVKRIAKAHDAKVGVKPNKPKGNNFYIKFST